MLELNCIVFGDDSDHTFVIEIDGTKAVGSLTREIWGLKPHDLQRIDIDDLGVYKVSFARDDGLDAQLKCRPEHDPQNGVYLLSDPGKRLGEVFGDPIKTYLHVIVVPPPSNE
jgi:hypothetical protein